jgi:hypothetical protein
MVVVGSSSHSALITKVNAKKGELLLVAQYLNWNKIGWCWSLVVRSTISCDTFNMAVFKPRWQAAGCNQQVKSSPPAQYKTPALGVVFSLSGDSS